MRIDEKLAAESYCYIKTQGRVSGNPHIVEIWFALDGATLFVLAGSGRNADFVKNALRDPAVSVRIGSRQFAAHARIVEDRAEDERARSLVYGKYSPNYGDLDEWRQTALPVAFDLDDASAAP